MRILVTGAAGFIGSNVALTLQRRHPEADIVAMDDFSEGSFENLAEFRGDVVTADMANPEWTAILAEEPFDQIFHLAAISDQRVTDQPRMMRANVEAFRLLLEFASQTSTPVVYASSASVYGVRNGAMRETDTPAPATVYAFSKACMDNLARLWAGEAGGPPPTGDDGWKVAGVRYFNVYGPRESHKGVPASMIYHLSKQMIEGKAPRIFEHGEQTRDFVYIDDAVEGTLLAMERAPAGARVYNIASGQPRSFNDLVMALNEVLGAKKPPEYFPCPFANSYQAHTEGDLARSRKELGYEPKFTLEKGVAAYMRWLYPRRFATK